MNFKPFTRIEGTAAPLMRNDLEVEFIASPLLASTSAHTIPDGEIAVHQHGVGRELASVAGQTAHAFAAERYFSDGSENPDFILNRTPFRSASMLLSGRNFGIGSMQLMASVQLLRCGIKVVIANSFGPTFREDSIAVGLLPIEIKMNLLKRLVRTTEQSPESTFTVDLEKSEIHHQSIGTISIEIDQQIRNRFLHGKTELDVLVDYESRIEEVVADRKKQRPWLQ